MKTLYILNIPNYYASYYLLGFQKVFRIKFSMDSRFVAYNNKPLLIFKIEDRLGVIDNDDPVQVVQALYDLADMYFVTNKLLDNPSYQQAKVQPLFPHYPVNILPLYLRLFHFNLMKYLSLKTIARTLYILIRRPQYKSYAQDPVKANYIFFSSNIWKKEAETNAIRAAFIRYCKADERLTFEGGFVPRTDGQNFGFDDVLNTVKYPPKLFSELSRKSKIVLNNAAVCGAVSWRLAEYLNQGLFVLSFPFKIELPVPLEHNRSVCFIEDAQSFKTVFDTVLTQEQYHEQICKGGKLYFETHCTPEAQARYIVNKLVEQ